MVWACQAVNRSLALAQQELPRLADAARLLQHLAEAQPHGVPDEAEAAAQDEGILLLGRDFPAAQFQQEVVVVAWPVVGGRGQLGDAPCPPGIIVCFPVLRRRRRPAVAGPGAPGVGGTRREGFPFALLCYAVLCFALWD